MYMEKGVPSLLVRLQMGGTTLLCRKRVARVPAGQWDLSGMRGRSGSLASAWGCPACTLGWQQQSPHHGRPATMPSSW